MRIWSSWILAIVAALMGIGKVAAEEDQNAGFVPIYNGKDLSGWHVQNGDISAWKADGDLLSCVSEKKHGGWLCTSKLYSDFVLRVEYRLPPAGNSGVGLRVPPKGDPAHVGMEIQILDDPAEVYKSIKPAQHTGSIYYQVTAKQGASKPAGEWNAYEITCLGPRVKVVLNGKVVVDAMVDKYTEGKGGHMPLSERPEVGFIGFQSHESQVDFRHIEVKDLTTVTPSGLHYIDLVNGTGKEVPPGATIEAHYTGRLADGKKFEGSRDAGAAGKIALGGAIEGLRQGIAGMKVGGRRKLIVPPELGYGEKGRAGEIPANATLVFDVEVVKLVNE